ncbi:hypothetical protein [Oscillibacter sp. GMB15532]|uniref:hypothetical protein n=1 Tax=Oscillibacter sp. GMB15532 TaxID=3230022 RepID=UPI0034DE99A2
MAIQTYINPTNNEEINFETASIIIQLPDECKEEWFLRYSSGNLSKLIVSGGEISITRYEGFHLDVDTRRVRSDDEINVDFAAFLPPFICISVLFAVSKNYSPSSIGPHMNDNNNLHFSMQIAEMIRKNQYLNEIQIDKDFPLSLCLKEPFLLNLSPDQHLVTEKQISSAIETISYYENKGKELWPVSICIEPLPSSEIGDTMTCRDAWTKALGQSWFEAEYLLSRFCPEAALGGRFSKLVNYCLWLFQWTEAMNIGSKEKDEYNGNPIMALEKIVSEWRAWSKIHDLDLNRAESKYYIPYWNRECIKDIRNTLGNPSFEALFPSFDCNKIRSEQQSALNGLTSQYNFAYNPLAAAGIELANVVLEHAVSPPYAAWCTNTLISRQKDGFRSIERCGNILVKELMTDIIHPTLCCNGSCSLSAGANLNSIYLRQKEIDAVIGVEQNFGINVSSRCKHIDDLWALANKYIYIIDRYFKDSSLQFLNNIPSNISIRILISDDDGNGSKRRNDLRLALSKINTSNLLVKIVHSSAAKSSHPLHDRYVFSEDWGISLSSSLEAIGSDSIWAFKLEDYHRLQQRYFDYFWNTTIGTNVQYGPRVFIVNDL